MSETAKPKRRGLIWWLLAIFVAAFLIVYFIAREHYTNEMLAAVDDTLLKHDLVWAGRGRDYAQYRLILHGREADYKAVYRIPASTDPVPAIVLLHSNDDSMAIFEWMNDVTDAGKCAIVAVNISEYFQRDSEGEIRTSNKWLGRSVIPAMRAVDLAIEFVKGHRIVNNDAVYLVAESETNITAIPAAVNYSSGLAGLSCMHPSVLMEMRRWKPNGFASPLYWVERIEGLNVLVVHSEQNRPSADSDVNEMIQAFASPPNKISSSGVSARESFAAGLSKTIEWILKAHPVEPKDETAKPTPNTPNSRSIVKRK